MKEFSEGDSYYNSLREKIIGLGEHSIRKSYYPELQKRIAELEYSQSKNKSLIEAIPDLLILLDEFGTIIEYSQGKNIKLRLNEKSGLTIQNVEPFWISKLFFDKLQEIRESNNPKEYEYTSEQNNVKKYYEIRGTLCGKNQILIIVRDITTRKTMENQLIQMIRKDSLTGLYNRSYFEKVQQDLINNSKIANLGLIICDINGLKMVNDTLGHDMGDILLNKAAQIIGDCFPPPCIVARIGGDEFGILIFDQDIEYIENAAQTLISKVKQFNKLNTEFYLSISTGIAHTEVDGDNAFKKLFKEADNDLNRKKLLQSKSTKNVIVKTLMKAMEARDFITEGHAVRLEQIVVIVSRALGMTKSFENNLRLLAQFHDLGKVGIPDSILMKPGKLTSDEMKIMQMHSLIGHEIASVSPELAQIADLILRHHERWDGTGYPLGITNKSIPLECRILSLADSFDAMTNDRPYRKALTTSEAVQEIIRCSGSQFDPELVPIFLKLVEENAF
jgi:diguanylate cyclase (GGDEF)-like protein